MTSPALEQLAGRVQAAARVVARSTSSTRDDALRLAADLLDEEWPALVEANRGDLERAEAAGMVEAARDRLRLTEARVRAMAGGLRKVAALPDPVGEVAEGWVRPERPARDPGAGAPRRGRRDLREPAQRDERRRRAVPQGRQRRLPARLVVRPRLEPRRGRRCCAGPPSRPACPRTPSRWWRTPRTRRRSPSCGCAGTSTASSPAAGRR